jgi:hypothetical protein
LKAQIPDDPQSEMLDSSKPQISRIAQRIAGTKIRDLMDPDNTMEPLIGEIEFEKKSIAKPDRMIPGILYDGFRLHELFQELLSENEINKDICHIIFTPRLFGTFDENDKRYHARVILCGYPSIISTSGIIEAPAKPREYYRIKQNLITQNITTIDEFVPADLKEKYLKYNDQRITEVAKGYSMQAISFQLSENPFCNNQICRLFNAHWQEEMLKAQMSEPEFCPKHEKWLNRLQ